MSLDPLILVRSGLSRVDFLSERYPPVHPVGSISLRSSACPRRFTIFPWFFHHGCFHPHPDGAHNFGIMSWVQMGYFHFSLFLLYGYCRHVFPRSLQPPPLTLFRKGRFFSGGIPPDWLLEVFSLFFFLVAFTPLPFLTVPIRR